jgi:hypothetical protein
MMFDPKCYWLAKQFLGDEPGLQSEKNYSDLAEAIQEAIEDWIQAHRGSDEGNA